MKGSVGRLFIWLSALTLLGFDSNLIQMTDTNSAIGTTPSPPDADTRLFYSTDSEWNSSPWSTVSYHKARRRSQHKSPHNNTDNSTSHDNYKQKSNETKTVNTSRTPNTILSTPNAQHDTPPPLAPQMALTLIVVCRTLTATTTVPKTPLVVPIPIQTVTTLCTATLVPTMIVTTL